MNEPSVAELDLRRLASEVPLPFAEFMALALYHPEDGYYTRPGAATGRTGDFSTSSDVSPAFGRRLAVQAADVWARLGGGPWSLVELGPGRGLLAADMLEGLAEFAPGARAALTELVLVEVSPSLAAQQRARIAVVAPGLALRHVRDPHELAAGSITGFVVGNEVLDALPVHVLARRKAVASEDAPGKDAAGKDALASDTIVERCVTWDGAAFAFVDRAPSDPRLAERAARFGLLPRDGHVAEVCLELEPFLRGIGRALARGAALFVDYGWPAARLADEEHADGTLLAYHRHRVEPDVLLRPGRQDITAHVNWDHFVEAARAAGLEFAGRTTQDRFLLALGLVDDLVAAESEHATDPADAAGADSGGSPESSAALAFRLAARSLIMPGAGGGKRFEAAALVKGIPADLRGLGDPFAALPPLP